MNVTGRKDLRQIAFTLALHKMLCISIKRGSQDFWCITCDENVLKLLMTHFCIYLKTWLYVFLSLSTWDLVYFCSVEFCTFLPIELAWPHALGLGSFERFLILLSSVNTCVCLLLDCWCLPVLLICAVKRTKVAVDHTGLLNVTSFLLHSS